jgi:hypothetical protein
MIGPGLKLSGLRSDTVSISFRRLSRAALQVTVNVINYRMTVVRQNIIHLPGEVLEVPGLFGSRSLFYSA